MLSCGKMGHIRYACRRLAMSSHQGKVKHLQEVGTPPEEYEFLFQVGVQSANSLRLKC